MENHFVYLSLLNKFEIIVYQNKQKKKQLLDFLDKLNKSNFALLDLPISIIENYISSYSNKNSNTCWSVLKEKNPDWDSQNNVLIIQDFLRKNNDRFLITSKNARNFIEENVKKNTDDPVIQNSIAFLEYLYSQDYILLNLFESIFKTQKKTIISNPDKINVMKSLELLCFFGPWLLGFHKLAIQRNHFSPKRNPSSIDVSHSFYIRICDIFVTDDEPLHLLLTDLTKFKYFKDRKQIIIKNSNQFINTL